MTRKLPIFKLTINEDLESTQEVSAVALVDMPAIGENFFVFKDERLNFAVTNEDERVIVGPVMIPDMLIYRKDEDGFEYNVVFGKQDISKIAVKFFAKNMQHNGNKMHDGSQPVSLVFYQSWIADKSKGIPHMEQFKDFPDGTWYLGGKINDNKDWQDVKSGKFKGFSVEGLFDMIPVKMRMTDEERLNQIKELLKEVE